MATPGGKFPRRSIDAADTASPSVSVFDGIVAIDQFASEIDRLNAASLRPNPFLSSDYLRCYALRSEHHQPGSEERLYVIRDGGRVIGCVPMRRTRDTLAPGAGPLRPHGTRLRFLTSFDTDQPGILSAPQDEERVAKALIGHLTREGGWGVLEFIGQRPGTTLHRVLHAAAGGKFRVRELATEPYNEVSVQWPDLAAYFRSLGKKRGNNISRQARRLYAGGEPQLVLAEGAPAVTAWFDVYCDLDRRSWKRDTPSSIQRHPRRVRFYREIVAGRAGLDPSFAGIVLDGILIAGLIAGSNASASPRNHGCWCLEMAYDLSRAELGPGQLLLLLAIGQAIERGDRHVSFLQNFAYYKHRWQAEAIEVVDMQLIRRMSLHDIRATLSDLKRRWRHRKGQPAGGAYPTADRSRNGKEDGPTVSPEDMERARTLTAAALAYDGPGVRLLDRARARIHLPFSLERATCS